MPVYFMQAGDDTGPIKVGHAKTPTILKGRLATIRTGNHLPVRLIGVRLDLPDMKAEAGIKRRLAAHCIRSEWFMPTPEVMAEVSKATPVDFDAGKGPRRSWKGRYDGSPIKEFLKSNRHTCRTFARLFKLDAPRLLQLSQGRNPQTEWMLPHAEQFIDASGGAVTMGDLVAFARIVQEREAAWRGPYRHSPSHWTTIIAERAA